MSELRQTEIVEDCDINSQFSNSNTTEVSNTIEASNDIESINKSSSNDVENKPVFEVDEESEDEKNAEIDLSKYTVLDADNLDEDDPIPGQEFALFSFMSPEGIMNCNVRAFKFRGAFPSLDKAKEYADKLKKKDVYFKIHAGESGKWLEFDPPEEHVEEVVAGNKKQQKIIDAQRKARMDKMNELAGRHKQKMDKVDRGSESRKEESKKAGAAEDLANKKRSKAQAKMQAKQEQVVAQASNSRRAQHAARLERLRKKLEQKKVDEANKNRKEQGRSSVNRIVTAEDRFESGKINETNLKKKTEVVNQASADLEAKKSELDRTNANIDKIRKMMKKN